MTIENLINVVRIGGRHLTPSQVRDVVAQLERIPALERTLAAKDRDFTQLSIAYSSSIESVRAKEALEEYERLKDAVRWERECRGVFAWLNNTRANVRADLEIHRSTLAASKTVEERLYGS